MTVTSATGGASGWFGGADRLASDTTTTLLLLRDGRNRACARFFGISERDAGLVTLIALSLLAETTNRKAKRVLKALPRLHRSDTLLAEGSLNEGFHWLAGDSTREVPLIATLILASVLLNYARPVLRLSVRDLFVGAERLRLDFDHRYGHLIRPNRPPRS